ncbi:sulfite exporter TauE/SafE-domain-containing protein [Pelagophyceae sp. CCMP2097]|nr:sulfite exporter TauE/SafE-domain-containing protein [Pelagophyceae sp. CCMP2097]
MFAVARGGCRLFRRAGPTTAASSSPRALGWNAAPRLTRGIGGGAKEAAPEPPAAMYMGATGALAGALGSLAGMGGGFVAIPMMTRFGMTQHAAHGTSLVGVCATGVAGALAYSKDGHVDWVAAAAIASMGMFTARLGAQFGSKLDSKTLSRALGVFMLAVAPIVPFKDRIVAQFSSKPVAAASDNAPINGRPLSEYASFVTIGAASGFLAGLFGVGGGAVVVPLLALATGMDHKIALGTSLAAMVPTGLSGVYSHAQLGNVSPRSALPLALGTCAGAYVGGRLAAHCPDEPMKLGFGVIMLALGARTFLKTL